MGPPSSLRLQGPCSQVKFLPYRASPSELLTALTGKYNNGQIPTDSRLATSTNDWVKGLKAKLADPDMQAKIEQVKQLTAIADEMGVTTSQLALAWTAKNPHVCGPVLHCFSVCSMLP